MRVGRNSQTARAAALIVAIVLTASCASAPARHSLSTDNPATRSAHSGDDEALAHLIDSRLNADPIYFYRHVEVHVRQGVAELSGYVWSTDAIYNARQIALRVPGVRNVITSHLELERNGRSNDNPAR